MDFKMMDFKQLYDAAYKIAGIKTPSKYVEVGNVGAALQAESGQIYTGINIDTACAMGFCAEHSAAAEMLKHGESHVVQMVAVHHRGDVMPPCGRCREFISQLNKVNNQTKVWITKENAVTLEELLPHDWKVVRAK